MVSKLKRGEQIFGIAMAAPAVVYVVAIMVYPLFRVIQLSVQYDGGYSLGNYAYIMKESMFREAVLYTILIAFGTVALELCFGFLSALVLSKDFKGRGFMRSLFILPWAIPTVASAFLWRYVFSNTGWLNSLFAFFGSGAMTNWLMQYPYMVLLVAETWKMTPFVMLILLAGLQSIPKELLESAHVDGATTFQTFRKIILPLMIPVVISALVIRILDALRIFTSAWIITGGGSVFPVLGTYIVRLYRHMFTAESAATSVVLILIVSATVICLTFIDKKVSRKVK